MMYLFRIEENLMDSTVCYTFSKKKALEIIKRNYFTKGDLKADKNNVKRAVNLMETDMYAEIIGSKKKYPAPNQIVEFGEVKRYKVK